MLRGVLAGWAGPVRDAVLVNAAVAIAAYRWVRGDLYEALADALDTARDSLDSGAAAHTPDRWIQVAGAAKAR